MIKPYDLHEVRKRELVPQAILALEIFDLPRLVDSKIVKGDDDFDAYVGAGFWLDGLEFAIMHYRGHPIGTSTIYLPYEIRDVEKITDIVSKIVSELKLLPGKYVIWQRKDDPHL
jgi:hypothetical protein